MAITSHFYDTVPGEGINETEWARNRFGGPAYGVIGTDDWKVSATTGDRTVSVSPGSGFGHGVSDTSDTNVTIQLDAIASGSRWDLIAMRRDWQPAGGGPSFFTKVTGTSAKAIPANRSTNPGVQDDQPIALVQVSAGQTQPTAIVDLRCWAANGGLVAASDLALSYLNVPGANVRIGETDYQYVPGANGTFSWDGRQTIFREWNAETAVNTAGAGGTKSVAFPSGMFTVPPLVQATKQGAQSAKYVPYVTNITTSGCTVGLYSGDGTGASTTTTVAIRAVQTFPNRSTGVNP